MAAKNSSSAPGSKPARIVLVDDHPMVRERLGELIESQKGFTVCGQAEDAKGALETIRKTRPDLAIVDLSLKDSFGLELIDQIGAQYPKVAMLAVTMHESPIYAERALRCGALGYLTKGEASTKILTAIRTVLDGGIYISESVASRVAALSRKKGLPGPDVRSLSVRELTVLRMIGQGRPSRYVGTSLGVDIRTVETYRSRIKTKLGLRDAGDLLTFAIEWVSKGEGA